MRLLIFGMLLLTGCAGSFMQRDYALERYKTYCKELNVAVEKGELTSMQASTLEIQAYNQYLMIKAQSDQVQSIQRAQMLGALSGMAASQNTSANSGQIINQAQKVNCINCT